MRIPPNVRHVIGLIVAGALQAAIALKADPAFANWVWLGVVVTMLAFVNAMFTSAPGDSTKIAALTGTVHKLAASLAGKEPTR